LGICIEVTPMPNSQHFSSQRRVPLPGSTRTPLHPEAATVPAPATERITVSVILPPEHPLDLTRLGDLKARLSREEFNLKHGPHPDSVRLVRQFAEEFGLSFETAGEPGRRTLRLTGTVDQMQRAFAVSLGHMQLGGETYRVRHGEIQLPEELSGHIEAVLGLDNRPQAQPHFRAAKPRVSNVSFTPVQVAQLYQFPQSVTASGETIGIIELGGGFRQTDLNTYFTALGLPAPEPVVVSVDQGSNSPTNANGADGEVMLDIEVCAAAAPGVQVAVYFAPNTDQGFIDAVATAVHDTKNNPSVISISWGGPESSWTSQAMTALDSACQGAAALGVTITVACGDNGSTDGVAGSENHVDFPASSPHVLACGGTKLIVSGSTITSEVVWNESAINEGATGGGVSAVFGLPSWQVGVGVPTAPTSAGGRGVPDVAGDADPSTGYSVRVDGESLVIGGTSAVAPLWAGLIALANAQNKSAAGFINPLLYASGAKSVFRDITQGDNGAFSAGPGWDACTGLGSPIGTSVVSALAPAKG
jgi:kumamolisin